MIREHLHTAPNPLDLFGARSVYESSIPQPYPTKAVTIKSPVFSSAMPDRRVIRSGESVSSTVLRKTASALGDGDDIQKIAQFQNR